MELNGSIPEWVFDGSGYGDGDGYGYGYGYGDGSGSGSGSGSGYGSGDGSGSGYGSWYWFYVARTAFNGKLPTCDVLAFWRSGADGAASNGGAFNEKAEIGLRQKVAGNLEICRNGLHATMQPEKWKGERLWIVALHGEWQKQDDKFAALEREIIVEIKI